MGCLIALVGSGARLQAQGTVAQPSTIYTPGTLEYLGGSDIGLSVSPGQTAGFNNAMGSPGNPVGGYYNFTYGGLSGLNYLGFEVGGGTITLHLATTVPTGPNAGQNVAPLNFNTSTSYTVANGNAFKVFSSAGATAATTGPVSFLTFDPTLDNGNGDYVRVPLNVQASRAAYEAVLNQNLVFDQSQFIDNNGSPINTTGVAGNFSFGLGDFINGVGFTSVSLQFTPVPEPAGLLAAGVVGMTAVRAARRRFGAR